jgi:hypothetical protein
MMNYQLMRKRNIFKIRNILSNIHSNYSSENDKTYKCAWGEKEYMEHVYDCRYLNIEKAEVNYEEVYGENVCEIKQLLKRFEHNMENRENIETKKKMRLTRRSLFLIHFSLYP